MTKMTRVAAMAGLGAVGLAALSAASPAAAATLADCGVVPEGATLTVAGNICQLDFTTAGEYSWTVPAGASALYAVLVGGGGGATVFGYNIGYAGSGGDVAYADFSSAAAGSDGVITVGGGGESGDYAGNGAESQVAIGEAGASAQGGGTQYFAPCQIGAETAYVTMGAGAGQSAPGDSGDCATKTNAPGRAPATDDDVNGLSPFPVFAALTSEFGVGGGVVIAPEELVSGDARSGSGHGADLFWASSNAPITGQDTAGSGRVSLAYTVIPAAAPVIQAAAPATPQVASAPTLAATGIDAGPQLALIGGLGVAGTMLVAFARRRRAALQR